MSDFEKYVEFVKVSIKSMALEMASRCKDDIAKSGEQFLVKMQDDLKRWTMQLATGELSQDDFEQLVRSKEDLLEMQILEKKGISQVEADRFRNGIFDLVIGGAVERFLKVK